MFSIFIAINLPSSYNMLFNYIFSAFISLLISKPTPLAPLIAFRILFPSHLYPKYQPSNPLSYLKCVSTNPMTSGLSSLIIFLSFDFFSLSSPFMFKCIILIEFLTYLVTYYFFIFYFFHCLLSLSLIFIPSYSHLILLLVSDV